MSSPYQLPSSNRSALIHNNSASLLTRPGKMSPYRARRHIEKTTGGIKISKTDLFMKEFIKEVRKDRESRSAQSNKSNYSSPSPNV